MDDEDESNPKAKRFPQKIPHLVAERDVALAIYGAGGGHKPTFILEQVFELHFGTVAPWSAPASALVFSGAA